MSVQALSCAFAMRGLSPSEKLVLLALANFANEDMRCWPSQERLAADTELSVRTVWGALKTLEEKGVVTRIQRKRADGTRATDVVTLNFSAWSPPPTNPAKPTRKSCETSPQSLRNQPEAVAGLTSFDPSVPDPSVVNHLSSPASPIDVDLMSDCYGDDDAPAPDEHDDNAPGRALVPVIEGVILGSELVRVSDDPRGKFDRWYALYPRKQAKDAAKRAFAKALKRVDFDHLLERTAVFAEIWSAVPKAEKKWIPHPATWLNGGCWDDDMDAVRSGRNGGTGTGTGGRGGQGGRSIADFHRAALEAGDEID